MEAKNGVKNQTRPIALGRWDWLFAGSLHTGKRAAAVMSRCSCCRTVGAHQAPQLKQPRCVCTGGHLTEPYEQNTQQSPAFGRNTVLQCSHS